MEATLMPQGWAFCLRLEGKGPIGALLSSCESLAVLAAASGQRCRVRLCARQHSLHMLWAHPAGITSVDLAWRTNDCRSATGSVRYTSSPEAAAKPTTTS